jgi:DNA repair photolyase
MADKRFPAAARGATRRNRFEKLHLERDADWDPEQEPSPRHAIPQRRHQQKLSPTTTVRMSALKPASIRNRGCEHGCIYCYARPTHEYLGFSSGLDFESKIMVKEDAPILLRTELASPKWLPQVIALSGVTDPYQPVERRLRLTRGCLEVLAEFRNPVAIITKNQLVTRDLDVLQELAASRAAAVFISITTLDSETAKNHGAANFSADSAAGTLRALAQAGIPAAYWLLRSFQD